MFIISLHYNLIKLIVFIQKKKWFIRTHSLFLFLKKLIILNF